MLLTGVTATIELVALMDGGGVDNINDAVTANLDLAGLMEDYLSQTARRMNARSPSRNCAR